MENFSYQRMFKITVTFNTPTEKDLNDLALLMTTTKNFFPEPERSLVGRILEFGGEILGAIVETIKRILPFASNQSITDDTNSAIPAGYTYLGQFIDHDISFDSFSDRGNRDHFPFNTTIDLSKIDNLNKPVFDLETIYGKIADDKNPVPDNYLLADDGLSLKLGKNSVEDSAAQTISNDFFRENGDPKIADKRNDSNLILAQIQVAFMKFHNAVVKKLKDENTENIFKKAREIVIRHYQYIILSDFLPRIVRKEILENVIENFRAKDHENRFYNPVLPKIYLPLEFTVGAFRFGHSMVRNAYNLNDDVKEDRATTTTLINFIRNEEASLKEKLRKTWVVNWNLFFDINGSHAAGKFNFAKKINTQYESLLGKMPKMPKFSQARDSNRINSLSAIDLFRAVRWDLPTGQAIAEAITTRLKNDQTIDPDLYRTVDNSEIRKILTKNIPNDNEKEYLTEDQKDILSNHTPFILYILAEAQNQTGGEKLGNIASWIVAEVFIKLLSESPFSIIEKELTEDFLGDPADKKFGMAEMLMFAEKYLTNEVINPNG